MEARIFRVVKSGELFSVATEKVEGGSLSKRILVLQEFGSGKYGDHFVVSVLGNLATLNFEEGDVVIASLRFQYREYNGQVFQDITANELVRK